MSNNKFVDIKEHWGGVLRKQVRLKEDIPDDLGKAFSDAGFNYNGDYEVIDVYMLDAEAPIYQYWEDDLPPPDLTTEIYDSNPGDIIITIRNDTYGTFTLNERYLEVKDPTPLP